MRGTLKLVLVLSVILVGFQYSWQAMAQFRVSTVANGEETICVRNYLRNDQGVDPCAQGLARYLYLINNSRPDVLICGMSYPPANCSSYPQEFNMALARDGSPVCVVNFHNPPVVDYCETVPQFYDWVTSHR